MHLRSSHHYKRKIGSLQSHWRSLRNFYYGEPENTLAVTIPPRLKAYEPTNEDLLSGAWLNGAIIKKMGIDRTNAGCRWLEDKSFCCETVRPGTAWCEYHHRVCYTPLTKKSKVTSSEE